MSWRETLGVTQAQIDDHKNRDCGREIPADEWNASLAFAGITGAWLIAYDYDDDEMLTQRTENHGYHDG